MLNPLRNSLACLAVGLVLGMAATPPAHAQSRLPKNVQNMLNSLKGEDDEPAETEPETEAEPDRPLTQEDVQLYLKVMRAAAERVRAFPASDRALLEKATAVQTRKKDITSMKPEEVNRVYELSTIDETVAREMGVLDRYKQVPDLLASREFACPDCGSDEGRKVKSAEKAKADAQGRTEAALIAPHRKEIKELERQVHPFSPIGYYP